MIHNYKNVILSIPSVFFLDTHLIVSYLIQFLIKVYHLSLYLIPYNYTPICIINFTELCIWTVYNCILIILLCIISISTSNEDKYHTVTHLQRQISIN